MNSANWDKARSDFNHAWLKNRMLYALFRVRQVLLGRVSDPDVWNFLRTVLDEWSDRMMEGRAVLEEYESWSCVTPTSAPGPFAHPDSASHIFLREVVHRRWLAAENPHEKVLGARNHMDALDQLVVKTRASFSKGQTTLTIDDVSLLEELARCLAEQFSAMKRRELPC
jgi:hypothetical protein